MFKRITMRESFWVNPSDLFPARRLPLRNVRRLPFRPRMDISIDFSSTSDCLYCSYSVSAMGPSANYTFAYYYPRHGREFSIDFRQDMRNILVQEGKPVSFELNGTAFKLLDKWDIRCLGMWYDSQWVPRRCVRSSHLNKGTPGFLRTP